VKKPKASIDEKLWRHALESWWNWYLAYVDPPPRRVGASGPGNDERVYERFARAIRSNVEHSDPPLQKIIVDEQRGTSWPASVHAIILDMPILWQFLILSTAQGKTQERMAEVAGISQSGVSAALSLVKCRLLMRLRLVGATQGRIAQSMRVSAPPAMAVRPAVMD
jgi:hypothetical protein